MFSRLFSCLTVIIRYLNKQKSIPFTRYVRISSGFFFLLGKRYDKIYLSGSCYPRKISVITDFKFSSNNESYINSDKNRSRNKENICTKMRALIDLSTQPLKSQFLSSNTCLDSDVEIYTCEAAIDGRILDVNDANSSCRTSCFDGKACTFRFLTPIAGIQRIICRGNSHIVLKVKLLHEVLSVHELFVVSSNHKIIFVHQHSLYIAHSIISILLTEYCEREYVFTIQPSCFPPLSLYSLFLMVLLLQQFHPRF